MPKASFFVRKLFLTPTAQSTLEKSVIEDTKTAPGQLRKKGDWYFLTYLRVVKVRNFNSQTFDYDDSEIDSIQNVAFQIKSVSDTQMKKLIVRGKKSEIDQIASYFEAIFLPLDEEESYKLEEPIIDLQNITTLLERIEVVADIKKVRMKSVEIKLGKITNCIVKTFDYGATRKLLEEEDNDLFGVEIFLKQPAKTSVYFDQDGQVRIISKNDDINLEEIAIAFAMKTI